MQTSSNIAACRKEFPQLPSLRKFYFVHWILVQLCSQQEPSKGFKFTTSYSWLALLRSCCEVVCEHQAGVFCSSCSQSNLFLGFWISVGVWLNSLRAGLLPYSQQICNVFLLDFLSSQVTSTWTFAAWSGQNVQKSTFSFRTRSSTVP